MMGAITADYPTAVPVMQRHPERAPPLGVMFLLIVLLPTLFFFSGTTSSLAAGTTVAAALVLLMASTYPNHLKAPLTRSCIAMSAIALAVGIHLVAATLLQPVDFGRAIGSLGLAMVIALGGTALGVAIGSASDRRIDRAVMTVLWTFVVIVIFGRLGISPPAGRFDKPFFPFTEPSHLALAFLPFYTYACVAAERRQRLMLLALGLTLVLALENLSFAIGWILVVLSCTRGLILPLAIGGSLAVVTTQLDLSYFYDRLDFSDNSQNLSTLVYMQGWQLISETLHNSHGLGVGFQQLGLLGTGTDAANAIYLILGTDTNILDGGFGLAKMVGEFGFLGIMIALGFTYMAVRSFSSLRKASQSPRTIRRANLLFHSIFVASLINFFVRDAGYFTSSLILVVAAIWLRINEKKRVVTRPPPHPNG